MGWKMRELVARTDIRGLTRKAVLSEIASSCDGPTGLCWRSKHNLAKRLGTDVKTVRRMLVELESLGLVSTGEDRRTPQGAVQSFRLNVPGILALPSIEAADTRAELVEGGWGLRAPGLGVHSPGVRCSEPPEQNRTEEIRRTAKKKGASLRVVHSASDHLEHDPDFAAFVEAEERRR
jgi:hypothetical protein